MGFDQRPMRTNRVTAVLESSMDKIISNIGYYECLRAVL
jgi:hypothetical protein